MKMKRYLSLLLAGTLALALTACGGTAQGQSTMAKLNTKMGISMKTLTDRSTRNLAEMLSEGSSRASWTASNPRKTIRTPRPDPSG